MANGLLDTLVAQRDNLLTQGASLGQANAAVFNMLQQSPGGRFGPNEAQLSHMLSKPPAGAAPAQAGAPPIPLARPADAPLPRARPGAMPARAAGPAPAIEAGTGLPAQASPVASAVGGRRGPPDMSARFRTPAGVGLENIPPTMQRQATAADANPSNLASAGGDPLEGYIQWAQAQGLNPSSPQTMAIYEGVRRGAPAGDQAGNGFWDQLRALLTFGASDRSVGFKFGPTIERGRR